MKSAEVGAIRQQLWDAGFRPVPVFSWNHGNVGERGKAPLGKGWTTEARKDPPGCLERDVVTWAENTGILCDRLRPFDIDIDDRKLADECRAVILEHLGYDALVRHRSNTGRCLVLYRAVAGTPKKITLVGKLGKIEVLGEGQQFVAHGVHPTRAELQWLPEPPWAISIEGIPSVTEDEVWAALAALAPLIQAEMPRKPNGSGNGTGNGHAEPQADALRLVAALKDIPNNGAADWEYWNKIGMALWRATGGSELGFHLFEEWSKRNPSHGEKDSARARWDHYTTSPPDQIGAGTIFHYAKEAREKDGEHKLPEIPWQDHRVSDWHLRWVPEMEWVLPGWIPRQQVTGLYGIGGIRKTAFLVQLGCAKSAGLPFLGIQMEKGPVYAIFCEDTAEEIIRKIDAVALHYGKTRADFVDFHFVSLVGYKEPELMIFDHSDPSGRHVTDALKRLDKKIAEIGAHLVMLDTAAHFFGGEEIRRREVTAFIRRLDAVSITRGCGTLITRHPSVSGQKKGGRMQSGSTGWEAGVRSRMGMTLPGSDEDDETEVSRTNERVLTLLKANYGAPGTTINMICEGGIFTLAPGTQGFAPNSKPFKEACERKFLELLRKVGEQGRYVHDMANVPARYAPSVFVQTCGPNQGGYNQVQYEKAMMRLLADGVIKLEPFGRPSAGKMHLALTKPAKTAEEDEPKSNT